MLDVAPGTIAVRAAVCRAFGEPMAVETLHLAAPRAGEVRVRVEAVAVCHSDISYAGGAWGGALPAVYGHEAAGRVSDLGDGVSGLAPGDPVIVTLIRSCGRCAPCASGRPTYCATPPEAPGHPLTTPEGGPVHQAMDSGAFAEAVTVHASQVAPIPEDLPMEAACLLSCGVITGVGAAVNAARVRPGQDVVVIGAGGVGLNAIQGARIAGARRIVAVDLVADKLEAAREFGATDAVPAGDGKPWRAARAALGRGADAVIVTVGAASAYESAPRYLDPSGRVVAVGMPHSGRHGVLRAGGDRGHGHRRRRLQDGRHGAGARHPLDGRSVASGTAPAGAADLGPLAARPDRRGPRRHPRGPRPAQRDRAVKGGASFVPRVGGCDPALGGFA